MSQPENETARLRQRIIDLVMDSRNLDAAADAILAEMPISHAGIGHNSPPEPVAEELPEERLLRVNPERLVVIDTADFPALFDVHYSALKQRAADMLSRCHDWQNNHKTPLGGWIDIKDDAENANVANFMRQLDDFAAEVDEARKKVKLRVYEAGLAIDGFFTRTLSEPVMAIRGVTAKVGGKTAPPGPGTLQFHQTKYLTDKAERERRQRQEAAAAAAAEAERKIQEARQVAADESRRAAALVDQGQDRETARQIAALETERVAVEADAEIQHSSLIGSLAAEPSTAAVKQHTAMGTTIGLATRWTFDVTSIPDLCLAVGAPGLVTETFINKVSASCLIGPAGVRAVLQAAASLLAPNGPVPATFISTDDKNIRGAITAKTAPMREVPGLRIFADYSARRRGG